MQRLVVILLFLAAAASPALAQPVITFAADAVDIAGFAPGAKVAWLSIAREVDQNWITNVVRREGIAEADAKGGLSLPFDIALSGNSAWVAVDLAAGDVGFGAPEGTSWRQVGATAEADDPDAPEAAHVLQDQRQAIEVMVVRPGEGVWGYSAGDGGAGDDDGQQDGSIRAAFAAFRPVAGGATPPNGPRAGDVIVAIDPERLEAYSFRVGQPR